MSRRRTLLALTTVTATGVVLAAGAGVASAHVAVSSADASPGGYGQLVFRVPDESDTASTTAVRIQLPADTPLSSVRARELAGWTATLTTTPLDPPVEVAGEQVTEAVTEVAFTADDGVGIAPGEYQEFGLSGGPFPDTDTMVFPVLQQYSDGSESAWIEPTVDGQPEPERPAPVLELATAGSDAAVTDGHGGSAAQSPAAAGTPTDSATDSPTDTATDTATDTTADAAGGTDDGDGLAVTALVLGGLGLVAGLVALGLGLAARRRTVSS